MYSHKRSAREAEQIYSRMRGWPYYFESNMTGNVRSSAAAPFIDYESRINSKALVDDS